MKPILVFRTIFRRRMILVGVISLVLIASSVVVATNIFRGARKTKAYVFCDNASPKNCLIYGQWRDISANDRTFDGTNLTLQNAGVAIAGQHNFNSLILDASFFTNNDLIAGTDFSLSDPSDLYQSGRNKKIDITVAGTLTLKNTSTINASG